VTAAGRGLVTVSGYCRSNGCCCHNLTGSHHKIAQHTFCRILLRALKAESMCVSQGTHDTGARGPFLEEVRG
jgi:hypothetical protein